MQARDGGKEEMKNQRGKKERREERLGGGRQTTDGEGYRKSGGREEVWTNERVGMVMAWTGRGRTRATEEAERESVGRVRGRMGWIGSGWLAVQMNGLMDESCRNPTGSYEWK